MNKRLLPSMALANPVSLENPVAISFHSYKFGSGNFETLVGNGVAEARIVVFASVVLVETGVLVDGIAVGKGVICIVPEGVNVGVDVEVICTSTEESPTQLEIKITNKVNMTILDEFNVIKRPFVIHRDCVLMLEYRPKIIVYWTSFGNNLV